MRTDASSRRALFTSCGDKVTLPKEEQVRVEVGVLYATTTPYSKHAARGGLNMGRL